MNIATAEGFVVDIECRKFISKLDSMSQDDFSKGVIRLLKTDVSKFADEVAKSLNLEVEFEIKGNSTGITIPKGNLRTLSKLSPIWAYSILKAYTGIGRGEVKYIDAVLGKEKPAERDLIISCPDKRFLAHELMHVYHGHCKFLSATKVLQKAITFISAILSVVLGTELVLVPTVSILIEMFFILVMERQANKGAYEILDAKYPIMRKTLSDTLKIYYPKVLGYALKGMVSSIASYYIISALIAKVA